MLLLQRLEIVEEKRFYIYNTKVNPIRFVWDSSSVIYSGWSLPICLLGSSVERSTQCWWFCCVCFFRFLLWGLCLDCSFVFVFLCWWFCCVFFRFLLWGLCLDCSSVFVFLCMHAFLLVSIVLWLMDSRVRVLCHLYVCEHWERPGNNGSGSSAWRWVSTAI